MFRAMRRGQQQLSPEQVQAILERNTHGILAVSGDDGYPYAVPLSYAYIDGKIYFHCALSGHKVDAIRQQAKVSFAVVDEDTVDSARYTTHYRSVIAFGQAMVVEDEPERQKAFGALIEKYSPDQPPEANAKEMQQAPHALIVRVEIEHVTGKASRT
ncbi:MAG: pyridoxamine 5'-phosphate oxidase family protein [Anaerotruncus sp.]|jgi:nitroimidazol reductase NimA-like FMN-containing flavoprotein (pyridoxamine 5'-phosphate oxidase superfamily)|nr:pyridoxamine 5'-phosphate oxidase family protein [Anaerotruncus sp.]